MGHRWHAHPQRRRSRHLPVHTPGAIVLAAFVAVMSASSLVAHVGIDEQSSGALPTPMVAANLGLPVLNAAESRRPSPQPPRRPYPPPRSRWC
jgi:hypothetical protein